MLNKLFKETVVILLVGILATTMAATYGEAEYNGKVVLVDKNCIDGKYITEEKEQFLEPNEFPSIQDLVSAFNKDNYMAYIYGILERRYPTGKSIIEQGGGASAVEKWMWGKPESVSEIMRSLGTVIHETGHGIDKSTPQNTYFVAVGKEGGSIDYTLPGMHGKGTTSSSPMYSMARSLVLADDQNYKRPPAQSSEITTSQEFGEGPFGCDKTYAKIYLNGDPTDNNFDGGDQGFNSLIEEYTQYINSLAFAYYFQDQDGGQQRVSSHRHAMLTWQWWMERYLRKIRNEHPDQYQYLFDNTLWLEFILTQWGRAWMYLHTDYPGMQPDSDYLNQLVQEQEMLYEIQLVRDACGCDNPEELWPDITIAGGEKSTIEKGDLLSHFTYSDPISKNISIVVSIHQSRDVHIDLFNSRGVKVRTLFSGPLNSGKHTFIWNGRNRAHGVYLYRIAIKNHTIFGKVVSRSR